MPPLIFLFAGTDQVPPSRFCANTVTSKLYPQRSPDSPRDQRRHRPARLPTRACDTRDRASATSIGPGLLSVVTDGRHALAKLSRVDPNRIGFWGLSQGGWLAVLAAGRSKDAAFAISVSAPLVTADEQMQFATRNLLTVRGYSSLDVQDMLVARRAWIQYLHRKGSREEAVEALRKAEAK